MARRAPHEANIPETQQPESERISSTLKAQLDALPTPLTGEIVDAIRDTRAQLLEALRKEFPDAEEYSDFVDLLLRSRDVVDAWEKKAPRSFSKGPGFRLGEGKGKVRPVNGYN